MMATIHRGSAMRGVFTNAFAESLKQADGDQNIFELYSRTVLNMRKEGYTDQIPEIRSTLLNRLILPINKGTKLKLFLILV